MKRVYALLVLALITPLAAGAVVIPILPPPLEIQASPEAPVPGATVTVSAKSYSGNPDETTYTWTVDGRVVDQGLGRNVITVTAGVLGSATVVVVTATEGATSRGEASVTIRPADVDIVWEGATYVPPFSGILPLPNGGSRITFVAIPQVEGSNGSRDPGALIYTWRVNNGQSPALAGRGKSVFVVSTPPRFANPFSVSVEAATSDGSARARRSVTIEPATPSIVVYEVAPLLGIRFDRAMQGSFALMDEASFEAFPLYIGEGDPTAVTSWTVNGTKQEAGDKPREITLRKTGEGAGRYAIGFSYASAVRIFEQAAKSFTLTF
jgi:hypothetical protein